MISSFGGTLSSGPASIFTALAGGAAGSVFAIAGLVFIGAFGRAFDCASAVDADTSDAIATIPSTAVTLKRMFGFDSRNEIRTCVKVSGVRNLCCAGALGLGSRRCLALRVLIIVASQDRSSSKNHIQTYDTIHTDR